MDYLSTDEVFRIMFSDAESERKRDKSKSASRKHLKTLKPQANHGYGTTDKFASMRSRDKNWPGNDDPFIESNEDDSELDYIPPKHRRNSIPDNELSYTPPKKLRNKVSAGKPKRKATTKAKNETPKVRKKPAGTKLGYRDAERNLIPSLSKDEYAQFMVEVRSCKKALAGECSLNNCDKFARCFKNHLSSYRMLPPTIDSVMKDMSGNAAKLLMYICREANNRNVVDDDEYGVCYVTYGQIGEWTGISQSNMKRYVDELCDLGLINAYKVTKSKGYGAIHNLVRITLLWYPHKRKLQKRYDKLVQKVIDDNS